MIEKDMTIVLQGDSITDAGRRDDPRQMGYGYAAMVADTLTAFYRNFNLTIYNRGISGNKSGALVDRWKEDCLDLSPDLVTLLIGVNDCWHGFDYPEMFVTTEQYRDNCRYLMESVKNAGAKLVVIEPFIFTEGCPTVEWTKILQPMIFELQRLAIDYADKYVPTNGIFIEASRRYTVKALSEDGVHPTPMAHRILAAEVLKALGVF